MSANLSSNTKTIEFLYKNQNLCRQDIQSNNPIKAKASV